MNTLRQSLADYLVLRRELGYKLDRAGRLLAQFVDFCEESHAEIVTVEVTLAWAMLPEHCSPGWGAFRLCVVRGFARYLHAFDPRTGVPPTNLLPSNYGRATPYLYSSDQITALMAVAKEIPSALRATTTEAIVGCSRAPACASGRRLLLTGTMSTFPRAS